MNSYCDIYMELLRHVTYINVWNEKGTGDPGEWDIHVTQDHLWKPWKTSYFTHQT